MNTKRMYLVYAGTILLAIAAVENIVLGEEPVAGKQDSLESLIAACQEAKSQFRPITIADLKLLKSELVEAAARLDTRLKADGPNGEDWRKYLLLDSLQKELQPEEMPNRERLNQIYQRFASGNEGLRLIWFVDVQDALRRLLMAGGAIDNPQTKTLYEQNLDKLAGQLQAYAQSPNTEDALSISESVRWLQNALQAPELVQAVERRFSHPNLYVEVSTDLVSAGIGEPVDDTAPVSDCIMGTYICGSGHTVGQTTAEFFPDNDAAVVDTLLFATTHSETVGYHGPVVIYTDGTTNFGACKRLWINEEGIFSHPAVSNAVTQTTINDIQARFRFIERFAWKKACKQKAGAEWIAARHAEQRMNKRVDDQAAETVGRANRDFNDKFRRPLCEHKLFPELLQFNTDQDVLRTVSMQAGGALLAAPSPPPEVVKGDMTLRVHESMINNFALDALGGMTVHEEKLQAAVIDMLGRLPEKLKGDEDQEPWAITFARRQPVSVTFADDGFKITIHGSEYYKGENPYPAMDVTAAYKIEKTEQGFKAVRLGEIQIFPPGRQQVGGKEQIIRTLLMKRFSKVFEPELIGEGFMFTGKWEKVGKMQPVELQCRDGWLTIAWKRAPTEQKVN